MRKGEGSPLTNQLVHRLLLGHPFSCGPDSLDLGLLAVIAIAVRRRRRSRRGHGAVIVLARLAFQRCCEFRHECVAHRTERGEQREGAKERVCVCMYVYVYVCVGEEKREERKRE